MVTLMPGVVTMGQTVVTELFTVPVHLPLAVLWRIASSTGEGSTAPLAHAALHGRDHLGVVEDQQVGVVDARLVPGLQRELELGRGMGAGLRHAVLAVPTLIEARRAAAIKGAAAPAA